MDMALTSGESWSTEAKRAKGGSGGGGGGGGGRGGGGGSRHARPLTNPGLGVRPTLADLHQHAPVVGDGVMRRPAE
jgi:hypothetical protein